MSKAILGSAMTRLGRVLAVLVLSAGFVLAQATVSSPSFTLTSFDYPGATYTGPLGINQAGVVVGAYVDASSVLHGFVRFANGTFKQIDYPGAVSTGFTGINDFNQMVGVYDNSDGLGHGFLFTPPNHFTPIEYPNAKETFPYAINNGGQIVGFWYPDGLPRGFSLLNG